MPRENKPASSRKRPGVSQARRTREVNKAKAERKAKMTSLRARKRPAQGDE